eukprot:1169788-Pleurochrysis_carterae.AAC.1
MRSVRVMRSRRGARQAAGLACEGRGNFAAELEARRARRADLEAKRAQEDINLAASSEATSAAANDSQKQTLVQQRAGAASSTAHVETTAG